MGSGKLSQKLRTAIEQARDLNKHLKLDTDDVPVVVSGGNIGTKIYNCTEGVQVAARCEGCTQGKRHYRISTPKTLGGRNALYCRICMVLAQRPYPPGVRIVWPTEITFMTVLSELRIDERFAYQVRAPFWKEQCMDFYNHVEGYYV